jgi:hypothetical protein
MIINKYMKLFSRLQIHFYEMSSFIEIRNLIKQTYAFMEQHKLI